MPRKLASCLACLAPLIGIAVLFCLAWIVDIALPDDDLSTMIGRFLMLVAGILGWAIGVTARLRRLHCGGTLALLPVRREDVSRLLVLPVVVLVVGTLFFVCLLGGWFIPALLCLGILLASLVGEVGWGKPLCGIGPAW